MNLNDLKEFFDISEILKEHKAEAFGLTAILIGAFMFLMSLTY